jgi:hypothetical protein
MKKIAFAIAVLAGLHGHAFAQGVNTYAWLDTSIAALRRGLWSRQMGRSPPLRKAIDQMGATRR